MKSVLVAGVGNFGSWWVISILRSPKPLQIDCFDVDLNKYKTLCDRISSQAAWANALHGVNCLASEKDIKCSYDLVVIATSSDVRLQLADYLINRTDSKLWIFEKVLAQSTKQLKQMQKIVNGKIVYVNHSRRMQPATQYLKALLGGKRLPRKITYLGGKWELASNAFHFVDMVCFFYSTELKTVKSRKLKHWHPSSVREGFYDTSGEIVLCFDNGLELTLDWTRGGAEAEWLFEFGDYTVSYDELTGVIREDEYEIAKIPLVNFSDLGALISLNNIERSQLPTFQESYKRTSLLLKIFEDHWKDIGHSETTLVPLG